eukprot:1476865-Prymnesium_polylepis.1
MGALIGILGHNAIITQARERLWKTGRLSGCHTRTGMVRPRRREASCSPTILCLRVRRAPRVPRVRRRGV